MGKLQPVDVLPFFNVRYPLAPVLQHIFAPLVQDQVRAQIYSIRRGVMVPVFSYQVFPGEESLEKAGEQKHLYRPVRKEWTMRTLHDENWASPLSTRGRARQHRDLLYRTGRLGGGRAGRWVTD